MQQSRRKDGNEIYASSTPMRMAERERASEDGSSRYSKWNKLTVVFLTTGDTSL